MSRKIFDAVANNIHEEIHNILRQDPNALNWTLTGSGARPVHVAARCSSVETMKLIKGTYGADLMARDKNENTPLHVATSANHCNMVEYLLTREVDVNAQDNEGNTPLFIVGHAGGDRVITLLLENGANYSITNLSGQTPADYYRHRGYENLAILIDDWEFERRLEELQEVLAPAYAYSNPRYAVKIALKFIMSCAKIAYAAFLGSNFDTTGLIEAANQPSLYPGWIARFATRELKLLEHDNADSIGLTIAKSCPKQVEAIVSCLASDVRERKDLKAICNILEGFSDQIPELLTVAVQKVSKEHPNLAYLLQMEVAAKHTDKLSLVSSKRPATTTAAE